MQAINKCLKAKIPNISELSLVDYDAVANKQLLNGLPFYLPGGGGSSCCEFWDGGKTIDKRKFLMHKGVPVGWINYSYRKNSDNTYARGSIDYLGVAEESRGKHYGEYLITYAVQEMEIIGVSRVAVDSVSTAVEFYKKMGFELCSSRSLWLERQTISPFDSVWPFNIFT